MSARNLLAALALAASWAGAAQAQPAPPCAPIATVREWNGEIDMSWSTNVNTSEGTARALHQASVGVRLTGEVIAGRGFFYGQPVGDIAVDVTSVRRGTPDSVTTIVGRGPDQSTPTQGGVVLVVDLITCEYYFGWGMDLALVTITTDGSRTAGPAPVGSLDSARRKLGPAEISEAANFPIYSRVVAAAFTEPTDAYVPLLSGSSLDIALPPAAVNWRFRPGPPRNMELVVTATPDDWLPQAGDDELTAGNFLLVKAALRNRDGSTPPALRARKMTFTISRSSHEPGIALNAPKENPKTTADLQFDPELNASLTKPLDVTGAEKETATTRAAGGAMGLLDSAEAYVTAFDYGAFGEVIVSAELEDGSLVEGLVNGNPGETTLRVPQRAPGSFIAEEWKRRQHVANLSDDDDRESNPEAHPDVKGDGFTLYEEYRGVMLGEPTEHRRLEPARRDFFVFDPTKNPIIRQGVIDFADATKLKVWAKVTAAQLSGASKKVVNFNHSNQVPHATDQDASRIAYVEGSRKGYSEVRRAAGASDFFTPRDTELVIIRGFTPASTYLNARGKRITVIGATGDLSLRATVMHELLHSINVVHHGEGDPGWVQWSEVSGQIVERHYDAAGANLTADPALAIAVEMENGVPMTAAQLGLPTDVWLGTPDKQHSGNEWCAMRYSVAQAKISRAGGSERIWTGREVEDIEVCSGAEGTGVNDPLRLLRSGLESRFGNATKGDCAHQMVVSDSAP